MFGVADYGSFVVAVIVFLVIPGPGNLALITSTGKGRIGGGLAATMGVIAGDQVLMWLAVAGVAALLTAYPPASARCSGSAPHTSPGSACACCSRSRAARRCSTSSRITTSSRR